MADKTYENIVLRESLGLSSALFGGAGADAGTLVVRPDGIDHTTKKRTVSISAAQVQRVARRKGARPADNWVVVDYDDGGMKKILAFQPSPFRGNPGFVLEKMMASLERLAEHRAP